LSSQAGPNTLVDHLNQIHSSGFFMTHQQSAIDSLKKAARDGKLVAVVGSGVSMALTNGKNPALSWKGLVADGFAYCVTKNKITPKQQQDWKVQLDSDDLDELLSAAEFMSSKLKAPPVDLYARWLESIFKQVRPDNKEMAGAIRALCESGIPICTLNYDQLLEDVTELESITIEERAKASKWISREARGILHLHGVWDLPTTCVLGIRDYNATIGSEVRDLFQRNLGSFSHLLFIGCGDTFSDPNFSALTKWLRDKMEAATPLHYALVTANEEIRRHADTSWHGFVEPVSYGASREELSGFLLSHFSNGPLGTQPPPLASSNERDVGETKLPIEAHKPDQNVNIRCIDDYEPRPQIYGRDDEVQTIVSSLLEGKTTLVAGGPGMGKTATATVAFYDPKVVAKFGRRRVFASLETATEPRAILARLVEALGLPPTGDDVSLLRILETDAAAQPLAAILDNAETIFDSDRAATERILNLVAQIQGLSIVVTIRGIPPSVPGAIQIDDLPKLAIRPAQEAFLAVAGTLFTNDPDLPHLLEALDGHALSIRLVAAQAIGLPSLKGLRESWDDAHAEILRISGEFESRLTSVRASLALSLNNRRMKSTPHARRLMALLAYLPSGLAEDDVRAVIGEKGLLTKAKINGAVTCLHQLRLVERRPDSRLRILTPLRECVKDDVPALEIDRENLIDHFLRLGEKAKLAGWKRWDQVRNEVEPEIDNLDSVCSWTIRTHISHSRLGNAISGIAQLNRHSGRGTIECLKLIIERLSEKTPSHLVAQCYHDLGMIVGLRGNHEVAQTYLQQALEEFSLLKSNPGKANSIRGLASVAQGRNEYTTSHARYLEALDVYRHVGDVLGEANCIYGLAGIALSRSDHAAAQEDSEEALPLYRKVGDVLGEANCIRNLAMVAFRALDHAVARDRTRVSLQLNHSIGSIVGEMLCMIVLGQIARTRSEYGTARAHLEEALAVCRLTGDVDNEAGCIAALGDISFAHFNHEHARAQFEEAIALFSRINSVGGKAETQIKLGQLLLRIGDAESGIANIESGFALYFKIDDRDDLARSGWQSMRRALVCNEANESRMHRETARLEWTTIGRLDLVHDWVDRSF
jgi:tetratricopeptide (TPR) repeat protein